MEAIENCDQESERNGKRDCHQAEEERDLKPLEEEGINPGQRLKIGESGEEFLHSGLVR
jgi:hypothetical protein